MLNPDQVRDLLRNVESAINGSSNHKGATLQFVRDTLARALREHEASADPAGVCEECGEVVADPDDRWCPACEAGAYNV
jgi:hypothetical protein